MRAIGKTRPMRAICNNAGNGQHFWQKGPVMPIANKYCSQLLIQLSFTFALKTSQLSNTQNYFLEEFFFMEYFPNQPNIFKCARDFRYVEVSDIWVSFSTITED